MKLYRSRLGRWREQACGRRPEKQETPRPSDADNGYGCSEKSVEVIEEVRDASAEQGTAESVRDVCVQKPCVLSDASTKLEDVNSGDENDGETR